MTAATKIRERPILFQGAMVRAILNTQIGTWPAQPINAALPCKWQHHELVLPTMTKPRVAPLTMEPWLIDGEQETDDR